MDIKAILSKHGIEADKVTAITDEIKMEIPKEFVPKSQYNKKVSQIDDLNNQVADLEAKAENFNTDEYKSKYEALNQEFETYKTNLETQKVQQTKADKLREALMGNGIKNEKLANLLLKELDIDAVELEDGALKGHEELLNGIKENYSDFFGVTKVVGNNPATPPTGNGQNGADPFLDGFGL